MKALSLFSCAGIGELSLNELGVEILAANELIEKRANVYKYFYPETEMIVGDIRRDEVKQSLLKFNQFAPELLLATPPCQGLSTVGKNKLADQYSVDPRNFLLFDIIEFIKEVEFKYILIENVPKYLEMYFPTPKGFFKLEEILNQELGDTYKVEAKVLNAKDYGVPQSRPRAIVKLTKNGFCWPWPEPQAEIDLESCIGYLPNLMPGETSEYNWHYAKEQRADLTLALQHTPTGQSALKNEVYFPKNKAGKRVRGFHNTYKRMKWKEPAHARTTYNGSVSSHNNVHPGHLMEDGLYSNPRVLTLLETFIVSTISPNITFPEGTSDSLIRTLVGEGVPPLFMYNLIKPLIDANKN